MRHLSERGQDVLARVVVEVLTVALIVALEILAMIYHWDSNRWVVAGNGLLIVVVLIALLYDRRRSR